MLSVMSCILCLGGMYQTADLERLTCFFMLNVVYVWHALQLHWYAAAAAAAYAVDQTK